MMKQGKKQQGKKQQLELVSEYELIVWQYYAAREEAWIQYYAAIPIRKAATFKQNRKAANCN